MIIISFEDQTLHDTCVDLERAEQLYGSISAAALVNFISEAMAFEHVGELIEFLGDGIKISFEDSLLLSIGSEHQAVLTVAGTRFSRDAGGRVVWATVTRLKLRRISRWP